MSPQKKLLVQYKLFKKNLFRRMLLFIIYKYNMENVIKSLN